MIKDSIDPHFSFRFWLKKALRFGQPNDKGTPLYVIFSAGKVKSIHESLPDAQNALAFKDSIVVYHAMQSIKMTYSTFDLK